MRFAPALALVATAIAACSRPSAPPPPGHAPQPAEVSWQVELEAQLAAENLAAWRRATGAEPTWSRPTDLTKPGTAAPSDIAPPPPAHADARSDRAQAYLFAARLTHALRLRSARETQALREAIANVQARRGERAASLDAFEIILAAEPDPDARRAWMASVTTSAALVAPALDALAASGVAEARALGIDDPRAIPAELRTVEWASAVDLARRALRDSEALYRASLRELAPRRAGVSAGALRLEDLPRLLRLEAVDAALTTDRLLPILARTLDGIGIALESLPVRIDLAAPQPLGPRAMCFPIAVPRDVRIVVRPSGGLRDFQELFHEVGHALHFVYTTSPELAFRQLGDASTAEGLGILWESVVASPTWLARFAQADAPTRREVSQVVALRRLTLMRRHAAEVLAYDEAPGTGFAAARARWTSKALGVPLGPIDRLHYLAERPWEQEALVYLRAHLLAAQLERTLLYRFGDDWWDEPEAGEWLNELWRTGQELTAEELAAAIGANGLDPTPLLLAVAEALSPS